VHPPSAAEHLLISNADASTTDLIGTGAMPLSIVFAAPAHDSYGRNIV